jgi:hypothetical protein
LLVVLSCALEPLFNLVELSLRCGYAALGFLLESVQHIHDSRKTDSIGCTVLMHTTKRDRELVADPAREVSPATPNRDMDLVQTRLKLAAELYAQAVKESGQ